MPERKKENILAPLELLKMQLASGVMMGGKIVHDHPLTVPSEVIESEMLHKLVLSTQGQIGHLVKRETREPECKLSDVKVTEMTMNLTVFTQEQIRQIIHLLELLEANIYAS